MEAQTIDQAISLMDDIVAKSASQGSRAGYFAALYRKVTLRIRDQILAGYFEDNARMEKFDVIFANRYLKAYSQWDQGKRTTDVWKTAFQATANWQPLVVQHLFLGMNAHINLDLGIAAARTAPGALLPTLKNDFNKINEVLAGLVNAVVDELCTIWPPLRLLTLGRADDVIVNFSMEKARDQAWSFAEALAPLSIAAQEDLIRDKDDEMNLLGQLIAKPLFPTQLLLLPIRVGERGTIAQKIDILSRPAEQMRQVNLSLLHNV